ncbi:ankyrin repeat protein [Aquimarina sp. EL_43]|uniref:ankyrin repeat domain-containing protein n=1 Tax=unclassified Aquimarina TaxID=2627091 RepID=UPI0018C9B53B|nr:MULTISPECIES: ankyrin repeat domain-containing protein [unclassified Aquimarina]MBG6132114.1 ankyrin repeat protein [Aquimarina sp. EL_35]MBG6152911.1 ankyrin repeat protein [Aquimarina sp. EL_32]MBG6170918.1 ankyrin repeat protein [Aquimarina sp. EL_43]
MEEQKPITIELFKLVDKRKYSSDDITKIKLLLEEGADVNYQEPEYPFETILYRVISSWKKDERLEVVKLLLSYNVDVNVECDIFLPIEHAARKGDEKVVEFLLENGADEGLQATLKIAIEGEHIEIAKILIDTGINLDMHEGSDVPFLNYCTEPYRIRDRKKEYDIVPGVTIAKFLIDRGANPNGLPSSSITPLQNAVNNDFFELVELLLDNGIESIAEEDPILLMVQSVEMAKILLQKGANINVRSEKYRGSTPLISSISKENRSLIEFFIEEKANLYSVDNDGFTAFHQAVLLEDINLIKYLADHYNIKKCNEIYSLLSIVDSTSVKKIIEELLGNSV